MSKKKSEKISSATKAAILREEMSRRGRLGGYTRSAKRAAASRANAIKARAAADKARRARKKANARIARSNGEPSAT